MNTIFITGVDGQLGYLLLDKLQNNPKTKIIATARSAKTFQDKRFNSLNADVVTTGELDLSNHIEIQNLIKKTQPDFFFNCAGISNLGACDFNEAVCLRVNTYAIYYMLDAIRKFKPSCRFLNCGSIYEFGNNTCDPYTEKSTLNPQSIYAASKCMARNLIKTYRNAHHVFAVQPWICNSESQYRKDTFLTKKIINHFKKIISGKKNSPFILDNLNSQIDFIDARDTANALYSILTGVKCEDYVISTGYPMSVRCFAKKALEHLGVTHIREVGENRDLCSGKQIYLKQDTNSRLVARKICGNSNKLKNELNWLPKNSIIDTIESLIR